MGKPKTPSKRKRRQRKKKSTTHKAREAASGTVGTSGGSGGVMQSMRSGFKRAAGVGDDPGDKPSTTSTVIWALLLLVAIIVFLYRWFG
ncbi:MAG TPA: hypothetical protein ENK57_12440 [Polyangiaceae bacterium]|nr:hypothetical protein [Polyangiaceae bacterium]